MIVWAFVILSLSFAESFRCSFIKTRSFSGTSLQAAKKHGKELSWKQIPLGIATFVAVFNTFTLPINAAVGEGALL